MGVVLTPIVDLQPITLADLRDRVLAVDGQGELYQFLALIRFRDGSPLMDASGRITSHLSGLFFRTTRLLTEYSPKLAFVFDGAPPVEKAGELDRRRSVKAKYEHERADAAALPRPRRMHRGRKKAPRDVASKDRGGSSSPRYPG